MDLEGIWGMFALLYGLSVGPWGGWVGLGGWVGWGEGGWGWEVGWGWALGPGSSLIWVPPGPGILTYMGPPWARARDPHLYGSLV